MRSSFALHNCAITEVERWGVCRTREMVRISRQSRGYLRDNELPSMTAMTGSIPSHVHFCGWNDEIARRYIASQTELKPRRITNVGATILATNYFANPSGQHHLLNVRRYSIRLGSSAISRDSCATCIPPSLPARPCIR
ncbi:uncharacterized protein LAESUDRAFT_306139 [Laetiporus sulphureus 93-53]|uniref:Uncharacterized protein n=1 Tax=Laetiporus sulphureus 93-53 TaxID=1314785 RepID=A0A165D8U6_9APHY|nr:uncharacterized protein LAESUDRAFT_306139 [Laetiporus sulphureus 93-53]KZT04353.1 hypothetical protein LAESUDRAFT_306139 [Laetiporus sulphureus 93-53]